MICCWRSFSINELLKRALVVPVVLEVLVVLIVLVVVVVVLLLPLLLLLIFGTFQIGVRRGAESVAVLLGSWLPKLFNEFFRNCFSNKLLRVASCC